MNGSKEIDAECSSGPNPKQMHVCIHSEEGGRDEIPDMFAEQLGLAGRADFFFFFWALPSQNCLITIILNSQEHMIVWIMVPVANLW